MGGICSCFHVPDEEGNAAAAAASTSNNCFCPGCLLHKLKNNHVNIFMHRQRCNIASPNQNAHSSNPGLLLPNNASASSSRHEAVESGTPHEPVRQSDSDVRVDRKSRQGLGTPLPPNKVGLMSSSRDQEECPTCLEEYTPENPKIMAKCSHHYHLSCIYEWKERSENCPVCEQLMQFDESS